MIELPIISTGLEVGIIDIKEGTIDLSTANAMKFSCTSRVDCCSTLKIPVTAFDIQRIETAGYDTFQIVESLSPMIMNKGSSQMVKEKVYALKRKPFDKTCTFLQDNLCVIHEVKPFACRIYPFSLEILDQSRIRVIVHNDAICKSIESTSGMDSENKKLLDEILQLILNELEARGIPVID